MLKRGDTVLVAKHPDAIAHLWIVLTEPNSVRMVVIVNLTDFRNHKDKTTVLNVGDHPFITKESIVLFGDARIVSVQSLTAAITKGKGLCTQKEVCSQDLLDRISKGIFASDFTPNKVIDFCHKAWN